MFRNYLLIVLRTWLAHKLSTLINVCGLTLGLTCAMFIMLFVRDELSYDRWIPDSENLYRVSVSFDMPGVPPAIDSTTPFPMLAAMADQIPEVEATARLAQQQSTVSIDNRQFLETIAVVDPQFFQVIKLPFLEGDPTSALSQPESVVISQSIARKYFGSETGNVGKILVIPKPICDDPSMGCRTETQTLTVTGILRDLPRNTQLAADVIIPNTSKANQSRNSSIFSTLWVNGDVYSYVKLPHGTEPEKVLEKLRDIIDRTVRLPWNTSKRESELLVPHLTRFWDAHLTIDQHGSLTPPGNRTTVYGFGVLGVLILLLACFNFTNLATAGATLRAREISLRKVVGARRGQIVVQFLGEAVLMALIACVISLSLIQPLLPSFGRLLNKPVTLRYLDDWPVLLAAIAISVAAGLISGLYPAIVLSNFKPALALRNNMAQMASSGRFRAVLVTLQFAVSIGLGIAATVTFTQISYLRHADQGFRKDGIVIVWGLQNMSASNRESFINTMRKYPGVAQAALSSRLGLPIVGNFANQSVRLSGAPSDQTFRLDLIGPEFTSVYEVRLLAGRLFSDVYREDRVSPGASGPYNLLINASVARKFGLSPEDAIGKTMKASGGMTSGRIGTIVGVIDDIKGSGPLHGADATMYWYAPIALSAVSIRVRPAQFAGTLAFIDKTWSAFVPGVAISRSLLEDAFNKEFDSEDRQETVLSLFVGIAISIASLGLFGLSAFAAERRTKEIGLRKTFGAKTHHIMLLLLWQFSIPVLIANVIACPAAYYYLHGWLNGYADRISLNPLYFVGAGVAALAIAWATVYLHAYRMARTKPINALRYE